MKRWTDTAYCWKTVSTIANSRPPSLHHSAAVPPSGVPEAQPPPGLQRVPPSRKTLADGPKWIVGGTVFEMWLGAL